MEWSTACVDWRKRIVERRSLIPAPIFANEGEEALKVFKSLRIVDVAGMPTFGEACEEWVFDFVRAIFGSYDADSGRRLIREFFLLISKKNAKSTIAAGIMITALIRNWRHANELLIVAPTKEVAENSFTPAIQMVYADKELSKLLHVQEHLRQIKHRTTDAVLKVIAADKETVSGKKAGFVLIDELWVFGSRPNAAAMFMEATGGQISRPEGFVIWLTTQSDEPPAGVFKEKLDYFRDIRDGKVVDPRKLPVIYEFPEEMIEDGDYLDLDNAYITNPNLGRSIDVEWLADKLSEAQRGDSSALQVFVAKHLNVEIGLRLRNNRWRGSDYWERRGNRQLTLDGLIRRCEVVTVGLDGGGLDDLIGVSFKGREKGGGANRKWLAVNYAFADPGILELRKDIADRLRDFEKEGSLQFIDVENGADITAIIGLINRVRDAGLLPEKNAIGLDPNNISDLFEALIAEGYTKEQIARLRQGVALAPAINQIPRKLKAGTYEHDGSALMNWVIGNAKAEMHGNFVMVTKQAAGSGKIDPLIASFCSGILMSWNPEAAVTDDPGIILI